MTCCESFGGRVKSLLFYQTVKVVEIKNWKIGLLHLLIQLIIISYVIGFVIIYDQGYQSRSDIVGSITRKVKSTGYVLDNDTFTPWDS